MFYRICVVNDFNNTEAFIWVQKYGKLIITDCSIVSGPHRGYQKSEDKIDIHVNFNKIAELKYKGDARARIRNLINKAPRELIKEFRTYEDYLFRALERRPIV